MYGDYQNINYFTLINRLSISEQLTVWSWILSQYVDIGTDITSPFRKDTKPSCSLREYNGRVLFTDFGDPNKNKYTCIHAVAHLESVGLNRAARIIDAAFTFNTPLNQTTKITTGKKRDKRYKTKDIHFVPYTYKGKKAFSKEGVKYWKQRYATRNELEQCFDVSHFYLDNQLIIPNKPCFALMCGSRFKLYQPYSKTQKWLGNTTKNDKWEFEQFSRVCVITSSYKDCLPWYRYTDYNVHAFMSETTFPIDNDYTHYDYIIINMDMDTVGIISAYKLLNYLKYKYAKLFFFPVGKDADGCLMTVTEDKFKQIISNI